MGRAGFLVRESYYGLFLPIQANLDRISLYRLEMDKVPVPNKLLWGSRRIYICKSNLVSSYTAGKP